MEWRSTKKLGRLLCDNKDMMRRIQLSSNIQLFNLGDQQKLKQKNLIEPIENNLENYGMAH